MMAAMMEESPATVPDDALLLLREQIMQQKPEDSSTHAPPGGATWIDMQRGLVVDVAEEESSTVPDSQSVRTPSTAATRPPPGLLSARSAPQAVMEAMLHASPSQEMFRELTKASSFHGFPGGDTQPMESQVYHDFHESMARSTTTTPKKRKMRVLVSPGGEVEYELEGEVEMGEGETGQDSPRTFVEGETGYVDLGWQGVAQMGQDEQEVEEESYVADLLGDGSQMQARTPTMPETPNLAGQKHGRNGEVLSSSRTEKKTPGFTQAFGNGARGALMSATQMFNQTQAPSSPIGDGPRSDPIITRPSPNIQQQMTVSSPTFCATSPVATRHSGLPSATAEPRDKYTSMKESQERRAAKFRRQTGVAERFGEDILEIDDDDEFDDAERRRSESKKIQRVMSDNAVQSWQNVKAPTRPGSRPNSSSRPRTTIDLVTPATVRQKAQGLEVEFVVSDDGHGTDDEVLAAPEVDEDDNESVDEYDELGQTVLRSQGGGVESEDEGDRDSIHEDHGDDDAAEQDEAEVLGSGAYDDWNTRVRPQSTMDGNLTTQPSAIADSQPERLVTGGRTDIRIPESSIVPGSQHTSALIEKDKVIIEGVSSTYDERVPSSPPLPAENANMTENGTTTGKTAPRDHARTRKVLGSSARPLEVPESDVALPDGSDDIWSDPKVTSNDESNGGHPYSTAQTHLSGADLTTHKHHTANISPFKPWASQQSKPNSQTPRTAAGVRRFADIANPVSSLRVSGESDDVEMDVEVDVEAIMSDVITAEDLEVFDVMASPTSERATKRRKTSQFGSDVATTSPVRRANTKTTRRGTVRIAEPTESAAPPEVEGEDEAKGDDSLQALRESPSKANELPAATPSAEGIPDSTPDSVKKRESAGANAASKLLLRRTGRTAKPSKLRVAAKAKPANKAKTKRQESHAEAHDEHEPVVINETVLEEVAPSEEKVVDEVKTATSKPQIILDVPQTVSAPTDTSKRILALFKGSFNNFYPASWLSTSPDGRYHRVRFEDGNETTLDAKHVRRLELRPGDVTKVDLPEMRNKTWVVDRVGEQATASNEGGTVHVQSKSSRASGAPATADDSSEQMIEVQISAIYLTKTMWVHFADREFVPPSSSNVTSTRLSTPSAGVQTPDSGTPASRSRRTAIPTAKAIGARSTTLREEAVISPTPPASGRLFSGMAFAISYGSNEAQKAEIARMITLNGGLILESGFDELFTLPSLVDPTSPSKRSNVAANPDPLENASLQLKPEYESLGFVALIADKHSRRAKYVQALALGLPTLSGRWLTDSLDPLKNTSVQTNNATPLPWSRYLLPAGESAYLGGATRSRTIPVCPPAEAKLAHTIASRNNILNGEGVLIVVPKRSKAVWERRKAYAFLTVALGAGGVKRVCDLDEAKAFVDGEDLRWKWVYVEGSVADASKIMFAAKGADGGKKRKRDGNPAAVPAKVDAKAMVAGDGKVRIVNDEFVIQSLILGALVE